MNEQDSKVQTAQTMDEVQAQEALQTAEPTNGIHIASDDEVRSASEKVFRLHARLFEALAK